MQIKITFIFYLNLFRMTKIKMKQNKMKQKTTGSKFCRGCGATGAPLHCWGCKLRFPLWTLTGVKNSQEAKVNLPLISLYDSTASLRTEGRCSQIQTGVKRKMTGTRNSWGFGPMLGTFTTCIKEENQTLHIFHNYFHKCTEESV